LIILVDNYSVLLMIYALYVFQVCLILSLTEAKLLASNVRTQG